MIAAFKEYKTITQLSNRIDVERKKMVSANMFFFFFPEALMIFFSHKKTLFTPRHVVRIPGHLCNLIASLVSVRLLVGLSA